MISRIEVKNFRMLRANSVSLSPLSVLVGKNATGKSTLIAAVRFVSDLVRGGVEEALANALESDAPDFHELCFNQHQPIEIALDLNIADNRVRYELRVGPAADGEVQIQREQLYIGSGQEVETRPQLSLWHSEEITVVHEKNPSGTRKVLEKKADGKDYFRDENSDWNDVFRFGATRAALGAIPEDESRFPLTLRVRDFLRDGVKSIELDSEKLRAPSAPRAPSRLLPNGSNLARVVLALKTEDPVAFNQWLGHVSSAVEGLSDIDIWERPEDKKLVLQARFMGQHDDLVPSWLLSDGTLRLFALSLLSYSTAEPAGVALIEEPENGLHPLAMQAVHAALAQPPEGGQFLVATHSPVFLAQVSLDQAIVFRRSAEGSALIVRGPEVPQLRDWKTSASLADVFATGVLA